VSRPARPARPLRILFQLPYPGYLRIYGSLLRELSDRGHTVLLAYDLAGKRRDTGAEAFERLPGVTARDPLPWSPRGVGAIARRLRPTIDYLRYLDPRFTGAPYLRERMEKYVPRLAVRLARGRAGPALARLAVPALRAADRALPPNPATVAALRDERPDVVVVSPLIARGPSGVRQEDTVKASRKLRVPVAAAITSWDHLTTKGLLKTMPDRVLLWNDVQRQEATALHGVPADRIVLTGAQLFDQWFDRSATASREELMRPLGLDPAQPYVLYVGSSPNITEPEREERFVRDWIAALRRGGFDDLGVLVRPHPGNSEHWSTVDLSDAGGAVAPRRRPQIPMTEADEALYFDSIHHAAAVVGINTSAIVESLIQRRPVLTIRAPEFRHTQEGTLHFHYLLPAGGGCVRAAAGFQEHLAHLREALEAPEGAAREIDSFVRAFVRPHGLDRPATPVLADAIEALARERGLAASADA
jgi:hypothetical protein